MDLSKLRANIAHKQRELNALQSQYRATTGHNWHGIQSDIKYQFQFTYEENFTIRFNYIPGCEGDAWTPDTPEEVEIVQVLFFGEPLTVNQENAFKEEHEAELTEQCWEEWSRHQDFCPDDMFGRLAKTRRTA